MDANEQTILKLRAVLEQEASEAQVWTLVESIPQIVWMAYPDGRELFFNQRWFDYTGLTQEDRLIGGWAEAIHPDDRQLVTQAWKHSLQSGQTYEAEFRLRRADGVYQWMLGRAVQLRDAEGQVMRWFGTATDIHSLKQIEEATQQSEREQQALALQLAAAQSVAKVGSWKIDLSDRAETWSAETYRIVEVEPSDFQPQGQAFLQFVHPDDRVVMAQVLEASLGQDAPSTQEHRLLMPDGRVKFVEQRWQVFHDEEGKPLHVIGTIQDITEQKHTKETANATSREIISIWESMTDAFYSLDKNWRFSYVNSQAAIQLQRSREEILGVLIWDAFPEAVGTALERQLQRAAAEQVQVSFEEFYVPLQTWFEIHVYPSDAGLSVYFRDINERKHAQQVLEAKTREITTAWESMTDALLTMDVNGDVTHINSQAATLLQTSREQLLGQNIWEAFPAAVGTSFYDAYRKAVKGQVKVDFEELYAPLDIWLEVHVYPSSVGVSVYFRDITERRHAQEALQRSEQGLQRAQRIAHLGYMERDVATGQQTWSDEVFRILGYEPQSFVLLEGQVQRQLHPDDKERALQAANILFTEGTPFNIEHRVVRPSGEVRWVQAQGEAGRNEAGQVVQFSCTWLDITERKQAEEEKNRLQAAIEQQQQRLDTIVATVPGVVWEVSAMADITNQRIDFVSDYVQTMVGYTAAEWMATPNFWLSIMHPDDKERAQSEMGAIFASAKAGTSQFRWITKDGRTVWVESVIVIVCDDEGRPRGLRGVTIDITERKEAESLLKESQQRLALATESAQIGIWDWDLTTRKVLWDARMYELQGIHEQEEEGTVESWKATLHPEDRERMAAQIADALVGTQEYRGEYRVVWPGGEVRHLESYGTVYRSPDGTPLRMIGVSRDITERKESENALRESEERFQSIVANVPGMVYQLVMHPDGSLEWPFVSDGSREIFALEPEFIRGSHSWPLDAISPDDRSSFERSVLASAELLSPWHWEGRYRLPSGKLKWIQGASRPQRLPDGGTLWNGLIMDVTARKEAEAQRDRFFSLSLDMMCIVGTDGYFKRLNPAFSQVLGFSEEELMARPLLEFVHPEDTARTQSAVEGMLQGNPVLSMENRYRTKSGSWRWLEWKAIAILEDDLIYAAARDVTQHKESEAALRSMRDELEVRVQERTVQLAQANEELTIRQTILESQGEASIEGILVIKHEGEIVSFNHRFVEMWGIEPEVIATRSDAVVLQSVLDKLQDPESFIADVTYLYTHRNERSQNEIVLKDGRIFDRYSAPIGGADELSYGRIWFFRDVTQHKQFEVSIRQAKEEAERANAAKSEFLSRMSHELRTPLNAILGFGQILEMDDMPPQRRENVQHILKGGRHLLNLINEVLDISSIEVGHLALSREPLSVDSTVREVLDLVRPLTAVGNIQLINEIPSHSDWYMMADRQRLKQVLLNLISNAIKYNRDDGSVTILGEEVSGAAIAGQDGEQHRILRLLIRDTGNGLSENDIGKLFVPFERLGAARTRIEGTGIGLALSKQLVEAMSGRIGVSSTPGQGSTFWIELPLVPSPLQSVHDLPETSALQTLLAPAGEPKTVLYIEDNPANLRLIEMLLEAWPNIRLLTAMQGRTGLDLAFEHSPDLILLDLHLPDINGDEVLRRLKVNVATRSTPVIIISADATLGQIERLLAAGAKTYLSKPLNVKEVLSVLEENLNGNE